MLTPREILLQRHQSAEFKLNAVRQKALAELKRPDLWDSWKAFVISLRWHLAGLGVVWMAVLILNIESPASPTLVTAREKIPPARVLWASLLENRRELMELTGPLPKTQPMALPPRRSELRTGIEVV